MVLFLLNTLDSGAGTSAKGRTGHVSKALHFRDLIKNFNRRMKICYLPMAYRTKVHFGDDVIIVRKNPKTSSAKVRLRTDS